MVLAYRGDSLLSVTYKLNPTYMTFGRNPASLMNKLSSQEKVKARSGVKFDTLNLSMVLSQNLLQKESIFTIQTVLLLLSKMVVSITTSLL